MSTLGELIQDASGDEVPLNVLLRGVKVLAYRLNSEELKSWIEHELDGYRDANHEDLPDYRVSRASNMGNFIGVGWSQFRNSPIPLSSIPEEYHEHLRYLHVAESVASLEKNLGGEGNEPLSIPWSPDLIAAVGDRIYEGMTCHQAWKVVSRGAIKGILDTIRNRLLTFLLELETAHPELKDSEESLKDIAKEETRALFNNIIIGDRNVVASGSDIQQTVHQQVQAGDFDSLREALGLLGVPAEDIDALQGAIENDGDRGGGRTFGEGVAEWLGKAVAKAASGAWGGAAATFAAEGVKAIMAFYGWS